MMDLSDRKFPKNNPGDVREWIRRDEHLLEYYLGEKEKLMRQESIDEHLHEKLRWEIDNNACAVAAWYGELGVNLAKQFHYRLIGVRHGGACENCFEAAKGALQKMHKQLGINDEKALWMGLDLYNAVLDAKKEWKGNIGVGVAYLEDILPKGVKIPEDVMKVCADAAKGAIARIKDQIQGGIIVEDKAVRYLKEQAEIRKFYEDLKEYHKSKVDLAGFDAKYCAEKGIQLEKLAEEDAEFWARKGILHALHPGWWIAKPREILQLWAEALPELLQGFKHLDDKCYVKKEVHYGLIHDWYCVRNDFAKALKQQ